MAEVWIKKLKGRFIVIDGPDGAGKSTQLTLLAEALRAGGLAVRTVRDPGGTKIGDRIRQILLDREHEEMAVECELMLYMASRAQLCAQVIRPALAAGACVLADRYISSTVAYQGAGGLAVERVLAVGGIAVGDTWPDLTVIVDLSAEVGLARAAAARGRHDRMEAKGAKFHARVRELFLEQARRDGGRFAVVDGAASVADVQELIQNAVRQWCLGGGARGDTPRLGRSGLRLR
jgi:dTMP kinase